MNLYLNNEEFIVRIDNKKYILRTKPLNPIYKGIKLVDASGYTLKDSNGLQLTVQEEGVN